MFIKWFLKNKSEFLRFIYEFLGIIGKESGLFNKRTLKTH